MGTPAKHVFISYVHDDLAEVEQLCELFRAADIPVWRDNAGGLVGGKFWKDQIRDAIRNDALVFVACFSQRSATKESSYMNVELLEAIEEFRMRPYGATFILPVRLDETLPPEIDLGANRTFRDIQCFNLFGDQRESQIISLVTTIRKLIHPQAADSETSLEVLQQAGAKERREQLASRTRQQILNPAQRIQLHQMVTAETKNVLSKVGELANRSLPGGGTRDAIVGLAQITEELWDQAAPFCASLHVAARWAQEPSDLAPWARGIRDFVQAANRAEGGYQDLLHLRHLPGMAAITVAALTADAEGRWDNLSTLVLASQVERWGEQLSLIEATDFYHPFADNAALANTLAYAAEQGASPEQVVDNAIQGPRKYRPTSEWLFHRLWPLVEDQFSSMDSYATAFDRAEVLLGALGSDAYLRRDKTSPRTHWIGRATWRAGHRMASNPVVRLQDELTAQGASWGPLPLFGGDVNRAQAALAAHQDEFERAMHVY